IVASPRVGTKTSSRPSGCQSINSEPASAVVGGLTFGHLSLGVGVGVVEPAARTSTISKATTDTSLAMRDGTSLHTPYVRLLSVFLAEAAWYRLAVMVTLESLYWLRRSRLYWMK